MDGAAGADALDDLLAEVAAFGEVQGTDLVGLLREILGGIGVADVGAVEGRAGKDAEGFEVGGGGLGGSGVGDGEADFEDSGEVGPDFEAGDERGVGTDEIERISLPCSCLETERRNVLYRDTNALGGWPRLEGRRPEGHLFLDLCWRRGGYRLGGCGLVRRHP